MTNRQEWDRPAMVIALVMGIVVVAASLPLAVIAFCDQEGCGDDPIVAKKYDITWGEVDAAEAPVPITVDDDSTSGEAKVSVTNKLVSHARIELAPDACIDTHNTTFQQQPAQFEYALVRRLAGSPDEPIPGGSGTFTCEGDVKSQGFAKDLELRLHPDIATVDANTTEEAIQRAWSANLANDTAEYVLVLSVQRPESQIPIPIPIAPTAMAATMKLQVQYWSLAANEQPDEVVR